MAVTGSDTYELKTIFNDKGFNTNRANQALEKFAQTGEGSSNRVNKSFNKVTESIRSGTSKMEKWLSLPFMKLGITLGLTSLLTTAHELNQEWRAHGISLKRLSDQYGNTNKAVGIMTSSWGQSLQSLDGIKSSMIAINEQGLSIEKVGVSAFKRLTLAIGNLHYASDISLETLGDLTAGMMHLWNVSEKTGIAMVDSLMAMQGAFKMTTKEIETTMQTASTVIKEMATFFDDVDESMKAMSKGIAGATGAMAKFGVSAEQSGEFFKKIFDPKNIHENMTLFSQLGMSYSQITDMLTSAKGKETFIDNMMNNLPMLSKRIQAIRDPLARMKFAESIGMDMKMASKLAKATGGEITQLMEQYKQEEVERKAADEKKKKAAADTARFEESLNWIKMNALLPIMDFVKNNMADFKAFLWKLSDVMKNVFSFLAKLANVIIKKVYPAVSKVMDAFVALSKGDLAGFGKMLGEAFNKLVSGIWEGLSGWWAKFDLLGFIGKLASGIGSGIAGFFKNIFGSGGTTASKVAGGGLAAVGIFKLVNYIRDYFKARKAVRDGSTPRKATFVKDISKMSKEEKEKYENENKSSFFDSPIKKLLGAGLLAYVGSKIFGKLSNKKGDKFDKASKVTEKVGDYAVTGAAVGSGVVVGKTALWVKGMWQARKAMSQQIKSGAKLTKVLWEGYKTYRKGSSILYNSFKLVKTGAMATKNFVKGLNVISKVSKFAKGKGGPIATAIFAIVDAGIGALTADKILQKKESLTARDRIAGAVAGLVGSIPDAVFGIVNFATLGLLPDRVKNEIEDGISDFKMKIGRSISGMTRWEKDELKDLQSRDVLSFQQAKRKQALQKAERTEQEVKVMGGGGFGRAMNVMSLLGIIPGEVMKQFTLGPEKMMSNRTLRDWEDALNSSGKAMQKLTLNTDQYYSQFKAMQSVLMGLEARNMTEMEYKKIQSDIKVFENKKILTQEEFNQWQKLKYKQWAKEDFNSLENRKKTADEIKAQGDLRVNAYKLKKLAYEKMKVDKSSAMGMLKNAEQMQELSRGYDGIIQKQKETAYTMSPLAETAGSIGKLFGMSRSKAMLFSLQIDKLWADIVAYVRKHLVNLKIWAREFITVGKDDELMKKARSTTDIKTLQQIKKDIGGSGDKAVIEEKIKELQYEGGASYKQLKGKIKLWEGRVNDENRMANKIRKKNLDANRKSAGGIGTLVNQGKKKKEGIKRENYLEWMYGTNTYYSVGIGG